MNCRLLAVQEPASLSCGYEFVYSGRGPDQMKQNRYRIGRIEAFWHSLDEKTWRMSHGRIILSGYSIV